MLFSVAIIMFQIMINSIHWVYHSMWCVLNLLLSFLILLILLINVFMLILHIINLALSLLILRLTDISDLCLNDSILNIQFQYCFTWTLVTVFNYKICVCICVVDVCVVQIFVIAIIPCILVFNIIFNLKYQIICLSKTNIQLYYNDILIT